MMTIKLLMWATLGLILFAQGMLMYTSTKLPGPMCPVLPAFLGMLAGFVLVALKEHSDVNSS